MRCAAPWALEARERTLLYFTVSSSPPLMPSTLLCVVGRSRSRNGSAGDYHRRSRSRHSRSRSSRHESASSSITHEVTCQELERHGQSWHPSADYSTFTQPLTHQFHDVESAQPGLYLPPPMVPGHDAYRPAPQYLPPTQAYQPTILPPSMPVPHAPPPMYVAPPQPQMMYPPPCQWPPAQPGHQVPLMLPDQPRLMPPPVQERLNIFPAVPPYEFPVRLPVPPRVVHDPLPVRPSVPVEQSLPPDVLPQDRLPPPNKFIQLLSGSVSSGVTSTSDQFSLPRQSLTSTSETAKTDRVPGETSMPSAAPDAPTNIASGAANANEMLFTGTCKECGFIGDSATLMKQHCVEKHGWRTWQGQCVGVRESFDKSIPIMAIVGTSSSKQRCKKTCKQRPVNRLIVEYSESSCQADTKCTKLNQTSSTVSQTSGVSVVSTVTLSSAVPTTVIGDSADQPSLQPVSVVSL